MAVLSLFAPGVLLPAIGRMTPTSIVAYLVLFAVTGVAFCLASLLLGRLLRAQAPTPQKLDTYECGEPAVGTSYVQFDLRFYVVALVFIIFEVEVAFFFPWAAVFGKATQMTDLAVTARALPGPQQAPFRAALQQKYLELGAGRTPLPAAGNAEGWTQVADGSRLLSLAAMLDMGLFFALLMVGFAYVWSRGDLDWVRAAPRQAEADVPTLRLVEGVSAERFSP